MKLKAVFSLSFLFIAYTFSNAQVVKEIFVADHKIPLDNNSNFKCFLIRERNNEDWQKLCDRIDSFDYKEGYSYKIMVSIAQVETDPPTMTKLTKYKLVQVLSAKKTKFKGAKTFENTKWILSSMYDGKNLSPIQDTLTYVNFNVKKKKVSGGSTCNNFYGILKAGPESISITKVGATKKMCDQIAFENSFLSLLPQMTTFRLDADLLTLSSADGSRTMVFRTQ